MFKKFLSRVKSQKGMSGVLVAVLLVVVGVGLVAAVSGFMTSANTASITAAKASMQSAGVTVP